MVDFRAIQKETQKVTILIRQINKRKDWSPQRKAVEIKRLSGITRALMGNVVAKHYTRPIGKTKDTQTPLHPSIKKRLSSGRPKRF